MPCVSMSIVKKTLLIIYQIGIIKTHTRPLIDGKFSRCGERNSDIVKNINQLSLLRLNLSLEDPERREYVLRMKRDQVLGQGWQGKERALRAKKCNQQGHNTRTCGNNINSENNSQIPQTTMVHGNSGHFEQENSSLSHVKSTVVEESAGTSRKRTLILMRHASRSASMKKAKKNSGMGILYDKTSGAISFSTGNTIMHCRAGSLPHVSDPNLTFPISNEREYRVDKIQRLGQTATLYQSNRRLGLERLVDR